MHQAVAQCTVNALATRYEIVCGESVILSHFGSSTGNISFSENFNSGQPTGWAFTQQATFSNPCSPGGVDGTTHIWMGANSGVPRSLVTQALNFGPAVAPVGGTICFDMLFAAQGGNSPCEGPDEPDEGVYLQYSVNGGATWININYFDPNGGNDPQLVNWNNWCFAMPAGALVNGVQFRWFQDADSGSEYDHWGIDNVEIFVNDPNIVFVWQHDNYTTSLVGNNPTPVSPVVSTTYTVVMTPPSGNSCQASVTIDMVNPDVIVNAGSDTTVCQGDCINLNGQVRVVNWPSSTPTFANNETALITGTPAIPFISPVGSINAEMNINVAGLNSTSITTTSIASVCINDFSMLVIGGNASLATVQFTLFCPNGNSIVLANTGQLSGTAVTNMCFEPSGAAISSGTPPYTGTFSPNQSFNGLNGCSANGLWTLEINGSITSFSLPIGGVEGWNITFNDPEISYVPDVLWSPTTGMQPGAQNTLTPQICPNGPIVYTLTATDTAGCVTVSDNVSITIDNNCCATNTSQITGPSPVCANATGNVYSVVNIPGSAYNWTVPAGATITSGQGTNSITVTFGNTSGNVTVVETIGCGNGPSVTLAVTVTAAPVLTITNPANVCAPATVNITVPAVTAGSTGGGTLTYWTNATATAPLTTPTAIATSGTYYIQSTAVGCSDIEPVVVTIDNCLSCDITTLGLTISDCYTAGGLLQYDVEGAITYVDPPTTGTLTITNCFGQQQIFNAPFGADQNISFPGLPQNGQNCDFVAVFSDDQTCTATTGIAAPPTITFFSSSCVIGSGVVNGSIEFNNPPSTGTLVVSINDGTNTQETQIQQPLVSPAQWTVTGLDPASPGYSITFYFSDYAGCAQTQNVTCGCAAEAGSTTVAVNGVPTFAPVLCENDVFTIVSNDNFVHPDDEGAINGFAYQPALVYLVYTCPPTPGVLPPMDPCLVAVIPVPEDIGDLNDASSLVNQVPPGTFTNGVVYLAPVTLYHFDPITPNYIINTGCWDLGTVTTVTYLTPITSVSAEDCQVGTVTTTLSGGRPANNGSVFTASNLSPTNASFANTTTANNGSITINGLQNGDMYSFDVTDASGCAHAVSGGPFMGLPVADAGVDATSCSLSYTLAPNPSYGTGTWTGGPVGTLYTPNANAPGAIATVPSDGTYTFTWTENNGNGCTSSDNVEVTYAQMSIPAVITGATCGVNDGEVVIAPQGGTAPYSYAWSSGGNGPLESGLGAGPVTVTVTDATGCSLDSTFLITMPNAFTFTTSATEVTCFGICDGSAAVVSNGVGPFTYAWIPNVSSSDMAVGLCAGTYQVEITENGGCVQTTSIIVTGPSQLEVQLSSDVTTVCIGQQAALTATITGGTPPYTDFQWSAVPADATLIITDQNPTVSPTVTTLYSFTATDANGCNSVPKDIQITVLPPLTLSMARPLAGPDTSICPYDLATLDVIAGGGDGNYTIYLVPDLNTLVQLPLDTQPTVTTTFEFVVMDGCTTPPAYATSTVTVLPLPLVDLTGDVLQGCDVHTVQFTDQTQPPAVQWQWSFGDTASTSNSATASAPFHEFSGPGLYDITLTAWTAEGCVNDTTLIGLVEVYEVPSAAFDLTPTITDLLAATIEFTDGSAGDIATWAWNFGDGANSTLTNPTHQYTDTGTFIITLMVTTVNGCWDVTQRELIVEPDFTFYIPNAFTPNNDKDNEGFRPYGEGVDWTTLQLSIYTRWGERIYYTSAIEEPWDGSYKGLQVESGVYIYAIEITDLKGETHEYHGHVTLLR